MNWDVGKKMLELNEITKEEIKLDTIRPPGNIDEDKKKGVGLKYKNVFSCCYTEEEK